jgi:hypothetical protein
MLLPYSGLLLPHSGEGWGGGGKMSPWLFLITSIPTVTLGAPCPA